MQARITREIKEECMYSRRLLGGFFNGGLRSAALQGRTFTRRADWERLFQSRIFRTLAYNTNEANAERARELDAYQHILSIEIKTAEKQLKSMYETLSSYKKEAYALREPSKRYEQTRDAIENMNNMISKGVCEALLSGKTSMTNIQPYGHERELLDLFTPILASCGLTMETESHLGQGEMIHYLRIQFPEKFCSIDIPVPENDTCYKEILEDFQKALASAYKKAETRILEDLSVLDRELMEPLLKGPSQVFSRFEPCGAAYHHFSMIAESQNISLSREGSAIMASAEIHRPYNQPRTG